MYMNQYQDLVSSDHILPGFTTATYPETCICIVPQSPPVADFTRLTYTGDDTVIAHGRISQVDMHAPTPKLQSFECQSCVHDAVLYDPDKR